VKSALESLQFIPPSIDQLAREHKNAEVRKQATFDPASRLLVRAPRNGASRFGEGFHNTRVPEFESAFALRKSAPPSRGGDMKKAACVVMLAMGVVGYHSSLAANDNDGGGRNELRAKLKSEHEVPVVISDASGEFRAKVDVGAQTIEYELSYSALEGTVTQAHIHAGQIFASGGIMIWLCANNPPITNAPAGTQPCPAGPATITGTITPANVVGPTGQAIPPGAFADAIEAIRSGNAYANVHSTSAPGGEIRGQIH
jgi:hypothetical protein